MNFQLTTLLFSAFFIYCTYFFFKTVPTNKDIWKILPREKNVGVFIGFLCLFWSAHHAVPLFENGLEKFRPIIWFLVPLITILSYRFLDFIFTRALGGFILLAVIHILYVAFAQYIILRPILSIFCYLLSILAMYMIGAPWRFRNFLKLATINPTKNQQFIYISGFLAIFFFIFIFL